MFGKEDLIKGEASVTVASFQSPCAGNMFGKGLDLTGLDVKFETESFNPRVRGTCLVRDPPSKDRL